MTKPEDARWRKGRDLDAPGRKRRAQKGWGLKNESPERVGPEMTERKEAVRRKGRDL